MICTAGFAFITIAACTGKDAPAPGSAGAATSGSTMAAGLSAAQLRAASGSLATYTLTVDNVTKVAQVMRTIRSLEKSDPALKAEWDKQDPSDNPKTIDEAVARVNSAPRAPEILKEAGISAHDYVYTTFAVMYASIAYEMKKAGQPVKSDKLMAELNPTNVDFVAAHQKEIQALNMVPSR